jgi:hypothetical protein
VSIALSGLALALSLVSLGLPVLRWWLARRAREQIDAAIARDVADAKRNMHEYLRACRERWRPGANREDLERWAAGE